MEVFFVYGLLILFALGVLLMVVVVITDPNTGATPEEAKKELTQRQKANSTTPNAAAYAAVTALIAFFCFLTFLTHKSHS